MVAVSVMQMAAQRGIKTINVIRDRPDFDETVNRLKNHGAYIVVSDDYLPTPGFRKLLTDIPAPILGLNATGGSVATEIARTLAPGGTLVTYGGMSKRPVVLPSSLLIFKDISSRGFWLTSWLEKNGGLRQEMLDNIFEMMRNEELRLWIERHPFAKFDEALTRAVEPMKGRKVLLVFDEK